MLPEAVALGAETRNLGFGTLHARHLPHTTARGVRNGLDDRPWNEVCGRAARDAA
jgi:hypothetical protein